MLNGGLERTLASACSQIVHLVSSSALKRKVGEHWRARKRLLGGHRCDCSLVVVDGGVNVLLDPVVSILSVSCSQST
jgi:hypothetical protein